MALAPLSAFMFRVWVIFLSLLKVAGDKEKRIHTVDGWLTAILLFFYAILILWTMFGLHDGFLMLISVGILAILSTITNVYRVTKYLAYLIVDFQYRKGNYDRIENNRNQIHNNFTHRIFENAGFDSPDVRDPINVSLPILRMEYQSNFDVIPAWNVFSITFEYFINLLGSRKVV